MLETKKKEKINHTLKYVTVINDKKQNRVYECCYSLSHTDVLAKPSLNTTLKKKCLWAIKKNYVYGQYKNYVYGYYKTPIIQGKILQALKNKTISLKNGFIFIDTHFSALGLR